MTGLRATASLAQSCTKLMLKLLATCFTASDAADHPVGGGEWSRGRYAGEVGDTRLLLFVKGKRCRVSRHRALKLTVRNALTARKIQWQNQSLILVRRGAAA